jgi:hypothetical protein
MHCLFKTTMFYKHETYYVIRLNVICNHQLLHYYTEFKNPVHSLYKYLLKHMTLLTDLYSTSGMYPSQMQTDGCMETHTQQQTWYVINNFYSALDPLLC